MAESDEETSEETAPVEEACMPCRGTGKVVSNKGGSPQDVECPWCKGSGIRIPGHDAQAHWGGGDAKPEISPAAPEPPDSAA